MANSTTHPPPTHEPTNPHTHQLTDTRTHARTHTQVGLRSSLNVIEEFADRPESWNRISARASLTAAANCFKPETGPALVDKFCKDWGLADLGVRDLASLRALFPKVQGELSWEQIIAGAR